MYTYSEERLWNFSVSGDFLKHVPAPRRYRNLEKLSDWFKVTLLVSGKAKIRTQVSLHIVQDQFVDYHPKNISASIRTLGNLGKHVQYTEYLILLASFKIYGYLICITVKTLIWNELPCHIPYMVIGHNL